MNSQKRIAADILKCGISRVKILDPKEVEDALTREDVRELIKKGLIAKIQKKGTSKKYAKKLLVKKKLGRRGSVGSKKGKKSARTPKKKNWIKTARPLRKILKELRDNRQIEKKIYKELYLQIKGGMFRNKKHLLYYLKEHELLKAPKPKKKKTKISETGGKVKAKGKYGKKT